MNRSTLEGIKKLPNIKKDIYIDKNVISFLKKEGFQKVLPGVEFPMLKKFSINGNDHNIFINEKSICVNSPSLMKSSSKTFYFIKYGNFATAYNAMIDYVVSY